MKHHRLLSAYVLQLELLVQVLCVALHAQFVILDSEHHGHLFAKDKPGVIWVFVVAVWVIVPAQSQESV